MLDLLDVLGDILSILLIEWPMKKREVRANLEWVKKQKWYHFYTEDPKWENMLDYDKRMKKVLGSVPHKKLLKDANLQKYLIKELNHTYDTWKPFWKIKEI